MSEEDVDGGDESSDSVVEIDAEESEPGTCYRLFNDNFPYTNLDR